MLHKARHGWIEVVAGVMFSGKSEELIRRVRRALIAGRRVQLFKSHLDDRYGGRFQISSHDGREIDAEPVSKLRAGRRKGSPVNAGRCHRRGPVPGRWRLRGGRCAGGCRDARHRGRHRHGLPRRTLWSHGAAPGARGEDRQAARDLRRVRRSGDQEPAPHRREAGARRGTDDPRGRRRVLRGALPPLPTHASASRRPQALRLQLTPIMPTSRTSRAADAIAPRTGSARTG